MLQIIPRWIVSSIFIEPAVLWRRANICNFNVIRSIAYDKPQGAGTMSEVNDAILRRIGLDKGYSQIPKTREHLLEYTPTREQLPPRSMQDSYACAIIPFNSEKRLQESYASSLGHLRWGKIMENIDAFAVWICHKHVHLPELPEGIDLPYTFVTICVDKIDFSVIQTNVWENVRLSGHVSWVGTSAMEITVWVEQEHGGDFREITRAVFLMAARNATNTGSAPVNPLKPTDEIEEKLLKEGEERNKRRKSSQSTLQVIPNDYEQSLIYQIYQKTSSLDTKHLNYRVLPSNAKWMHTSSVSNTMVSYPEHRNAHDTVFGGYLMRCAIETSKVCTNLYAKTQPVLRHISDIKFTKPIEVTSIIDMSSYIVYTEKNYVQVMTVAAILDPLTSSEKTSNVFYLTYSCSNMVPEVLPHTYHETLWYLQGRRQFRYSLGLK